MVVIRWLSAVRAGVRAWPRARYLALLALCALLLSAPSALAIIRDVEPGSVPTLRSGEGLLLIAVDTDRALDSVRVIRIGGAAEMKTLSNLPIGRNLRLVAAPAGRYRWSWLQPSDSRFYYPLRDEQFAFEVRPGRINYPGEILYRAGKPGASWLHFANRGLPALDWMRQHHAGVLTAFDFEYSGRYPDPFPAFYREVAPPGVPTTPRVSPPPEAGTLPLPIAELWRPNQISHVELNPAGDMMVEVTRIERIGQRLWAIDLVDLDSGRRKRLTESPKPVARLDWAGDRMLIISVAAATDGSHSLIAVGIDSGSQGRIYRVAMVPRQGWLISVLRDAPGRILFQSSVAHGPGTVHPLDLRDGDALAAYDFPKRERLDRGVDGVLRWYADGQGRLRGAIADDGKGKYSLVYEIDGKFRPVLDLSDEADFWPHAMSADGRLFYGIAERGRGQRDLVEFDPAAGKVTRTLLSLPGIDIQGPVFDAAGALIGAFLYRDGLPVTHYFGEVAGEDPLVAAARAFPGGNAFILQRDAAARRYLVSVNASDRPQVIHLYDRATQKFRELAQTRPWLAERRLAPSRVVRAKSRDGLEIEAYLTLPATASGKVPLVLFPHGGPIGVRDFRNFNPEVQFLASLGYAVLQVNFRGSEGFGTAFRQAGAGSFGSAIEDDIDAVLTAALAAHPLDATRMCAVGASYGGYSAMISAIRWPERFRCVVSIAGVADLPLLFTASDTALWAEARTWMETHIGDPNKDLDTLRTRSPLYRYRELRAPVMLVHGTDDLRVDYEHSRRLVRMLNHDGRPPVMLTFEGEGHAIDDTASNRRLWEGVAGFLRAHLGDPPAPR
jgi:dipeptidyl aminopeptidase/acylaminoacyl peptidase